MRKNNVDFNHIKVLILDDDQDVIETLSQKISKEGFLCKGHTSPDEIIKIIKEEKTDILVVDYLMIDETGLKVVQRIREFNNNIYIILLTSYTELMPIEKALKNFDIDSYSTKQADSSDLIQKLFIATKTISKFQKNRLEFNVNNLSNNLRFLRKKNDLTQEELSEILNLTRSTIASYETSLIKPSLNQLQKIADYFDITIDQLLSNDIKKCI